MPKQHLPGTELEGTVSKGHDGAERRALHAAALLAARRLRTGEPAAKSTPDRAASAPRAAEAAFLDAAAEALRDAARSALASAPVALEERLLDLAVSSRADALPRLAGTLRGIAGDLSERRNRAARFDPVEALAAVARVSTARPGIDARFGELDPVDGWLWVPHTRFGNTVLSVDCATGGTDKVRLPAGNRSVRVRFVRNGSSLLTVGERGTLSRHRRDGSVVWLVDVSSLGRVGAGDLLTVSAATSSRFRRQRAQSGAKI